VTDQNHQATLDLLRELHNEAEYYYEESTDFTYEPFENILAKVGEYLKQRRAENG
jgi:hypothetical protein